MRRVLVAAAVALMATPAWGDEQDNFIMVIDAGRLGVMMNQSQEILGQPSDPARDGSTETWAVLRRAVFDYQRLLPVACARHAVAKEVCEPAFYAPRWLGDAAAPTPEVLRGRIDEAQAHVGALWGGLCARLPKKHDESWCQLE